MTIETPLLNTPERLAPLVESGQLPTRRVWGMLAIRSGLTFAMLMALAAAFAAAGRSEAIRDSAAWWLWFVTVVNVVCVVLMARFAKQEGGLRLRDIYFASRATWKGDLLWLGIGFVGTALLAQAPGTLLAGLLWADPATPNPMLFQKLPLLAIYPLFLLMPLTHAFAELPTYWGYVAPRLRAAGMRPWVVIGLVGLVLSVQHMFFSFQLDWRYDLWLAIKFLPFAMWTGWLVYRRPTVLPYLMGVHALLDSMLPLLLLMVARGIPLS